jgi:hypothetical protein
MQQRLTHRTASARPQLLVSSSPASLESSASGLLSHAHRSCSRPDPATPRPAPLSSPDTDGGKGGRHAKQPCDAKQESQVPRAARSSISPTPNLLLAWSARSFRGTTLVRTACLPHSHGLVAYNSKHGCLEARPRRSRSATSSSPALGKCALANYVSSMSADADR